MTTEAAIQFFQTLADPTRLRILLLLQANGELCVCELTAALGISQPKVSRHLARLRGAGILDDRRQGTWVFYRLHPELPEWQRRVLDESARQPAIREVLTADWARLARAAVPRPRVCIP